MVQSRGLVEGGPDTMKEQRLDLVRELRDLQRRIDVVRAIGVANRGARP